MRTWTALFALFLVGALANAETTTTKKAVAQHRATKKQTAPTYTPTYSYSRHYTTTSPWDFAGEIGLYNPGFGFRGLAAYRLVEDVVTGVDNSLSFETGLGYISVSDTVAGASVSYSFIEIPLMARWDFKPRSMNNFIVGPRAGFNYLAGGGSVTVNGIGYNVRGNALYFQMGGFGMYKFNSNWAARADLMFINYTALTFGVNYFM